MTFEENLKYKGDIPLVAYINFETRAPTDQCLDLENRKKFAISYFIIFAFRPDLHIDRVIIERSFWHSLKRLVYLSYLMRKQHIQSQKNDDAIETLRASCPCKK